MQKYSCKEKITIGVAAYGNLKATKTCIESIKNSIDGNFEIILVDDYSPDNEEIKNYFLSLKKEFKNIKVFYFTENLGYANSVNCILSNSTSQKIIFISNDIYVNSYFLEELINISNITKNIGYVRGVSNFVDGSLSSHNIDFKENTYIDPIKVAREIFLKEKNNFSEEEYLTGDCFLVNRKLIEKIGYFDCANFKDYFGDVDFGVRTKAFDFKCILSKGAFCYHHRNTNFDYLSEEQKKQKIGRRRYFTIEDWARFKLKYNLPNNLFYPGINKIDFNEIKNKVDKNEVIEKKDYSKYLI